MIKECSYHIQKEAKTSHGRLDSELNMTLRAMVLRAIEIKCVQALLS